MADQPDETPRSIAGRWLQELKSAEIYGKISKWHKQGDKIIRRYKDERDDQRDGLTFRRMRMNLLWSNVETLKPALYARTPKPNVQRRNKDKDPVGRWASVVLERCLAFTLGYQDFDHTMRESVSDYLLPGRGVAWEVYEPQIVSVEGADQLEWETTKTKYVHWKDFLTNPARTWDEVWWVAKRAYQSRAEVLNLLLTLGVDKKQATAIANDIQLDHSAETDDKREAGDEKNRKATVWCIWNKVKREVVYVSPGYTDAPLAITKPPLKLDNFFPCPRPLTTTVATDSIIPVPDFAQYQDQADEVDELTQRIYLLQRALKVVGVYDGKIQGIDGLLNDATDNTMIPVETWAMFAQQGGLKGSVDFFPIEMVANTLKQCIETREVAKQVLYEVTGISDIVRGASDPNETATAQQIKSQWGSLRVRDRQAEVARFARDIIRIKAEVICETFSDDTIKTMSGVKLLTQADKQRLAMQAQQAMMQAPVGRVASATGAGGGLTQTGMAAPSPSPAPTPPDIQQLMQEPTWEEVLGLLRSEKLRGFAIDIEADSTITPDEQAERQSRVEMLTAITQYVTGWGQILMMAPSLAPLAGDLLLFGLRAFKTGETIETNVETAMQGLQKQLSQPRPDPEQQKAEMELAVENKRADNQMAIDNKKAENDMAIARTKAQADMEMKQVELGHKRQMAEIDQNHAMTMAQQKATQDGEIARQNADTKNQIAGMRADHEVMNEGITGKTEQMMKQQVGALGEQLGKGLAALGDGLAKLAEATNQQGESFKQGMSQLAQAVMAENELVRDPKTGKAMGTRKRPPNLQ